MENKVIESFMGYLEYLKSKEGSKTKAPVTGQTAQRLHGVGGLFSGQGIDPTVFTTQVEPRGLIDILPAFPSMSDDPRFAVITGVSDFEGSRPNRVCDDIGSSYMKKCELTAQYGLITHQTNTIDAMDMGRRINRGDFRDLEVFGIDPNVMANPGSVNVSDIANSVADAQLYMLGVNMRRDMYLQSWQGDPSVNSPGGGYKESPGLDSQISEGQVDVATSTACPSVDSVVYSYNYNNVDGSDGANIAEYLQSAVYQVTDLADRTGLSPVEFAVVMSRQLWHELTKVWPILYFTDSINAALNSATNSRINFPASNPVEMRDRMRSDMMLTVNGIPMRVVVDDGIFEKNSTNDAANLDPGQYASSIYIVPLRVMGRFNVTYRNYIDYRIPSQMLGAFGNNFSRNFWQQEGQYAYSYDNVKWCITISGRTEQRVVLRTPQLAARIDNILYQPIDKVRSPFPDNPHWVNGGVSSVPAPAKNAVYL